MHKIRRIRFVIKKVSISINECSPITVDEKHKYSQTQMVTSEIVHEYRYASRGYFKFFSLTTPLTYSNQFSFVLPT